MVSADDGLEHTYGVVIAARQLDESAGDAGPQAEGLAELSLLIVRLQLVEIALWLEQRTLNFVDASAGDKNEAGDSLGSVGGDRAA